MKKKFYLFTIIIFFSLSLFGVGKKESASDYLETRWDKEFTSHPANTIRDSIPNGNQIYFTAISPRLYNRDDEPLRIKSDFERQLLWYQGVHVNGEFLDYEQGSLAFSKWYKIGIAPLSSVLSFDSNIDPDRSVIDVDGRASQFIIKTKIDLSPKFSSALRYARGVNDLFEAVTFEKNYSVAVGVALRSASRSESWLAADKAALLELARLKGLEMKAKSLSKESSTNGGTSVVTTGSLMKLNGDIKGFYVLYRWHNDNYFYSVAISK